MAYTDDAVLAKLSALNETHDSIATAAQWIMFHRYVDDYETEDGQKKGILDTNERHRRHAERTVQLWFQRLKDSPSAKRLNLVYLANGTLPCIPKRHLSLTLSSRGDPAIEGGATRGFCCCLLASHCRSDCGRIQRGTVRGAE